MRVCISFGLFLGFFLGSALSERSFDRRDGDGLLYVCYVGNVLRNDGISSRVIRTAEIELALSVTTSADEIKGFGVSLGVLVDDGFLVEVKKLVSLSLRVGVFAKNDTLAILLVPSNASITVVSLLKLLVSRSIVAGVGVSISS